MRSAGSQRLKESSRGNSSYVLSTSPASYATPPAPQLLQTWLQLLKPMPTSRPPRLAEAYIGMRQHQPSLLKHLHEGATALPLMECNCIHRRGVQLYTLHTSNTSLLEALTDLSSGYSQMAETVLNTAAHETTVSSKNEFPET